MSLGSHRCHTGAAGHLGPQHSGSIGNVAAIEVWIPAGYVGIGATHLQVREVFDDGIGWDEIPCNVQKHHIRFDDCRWEKDADGAMYWKGRVTNEDESNMKRWRVIIDYEMPA